MKKLLLLLIFAILMTVSLCACDWMFGAPKNGSDMTVTTDTSKNDDTTEGVELTVNADEDKINDGDSEISTGGQMESNSHSEPNDSLELKELIYVHLDYGMTKIVELRNGKMEIKRLVEEILELNFADYTCLINGNTVEFNNEIVVGGDHISLIPKSENPDDNENDNSYVYKVCFDAGNGNVTDVFMSTPTMELYDFIEKVLELNFDKMAELGEWRVNDKLADSQTVVNEGDRVSLIFSIDYPPENPGDNEGEDTDRYIVIVDLGNGNVDTYLMKEETMSLCDFVEKILSTSFATSNRYGEWLINDNSSNAQSIVTAGDRVTYIPYD